jgi:hypothetical protein
VPALHITPIPTEHAESYWSGGLDAHGLKPERHVSDGAGIPCRHCLDEVAQGKTYLILAYRPFLEMQPYAEVGPIFLHAEPCSPYQQNEAIPAMYLDGEPRILRGYDRDNRIIYGTGKVVPPPDMARYSGKLLGDPAIAYVHVRSSANNCFAFRIDRSSARDRA